MGSCWPRSRLVGRGCSPRAGTAAAAAAVPGSPWSRGVGAPPGSSAAGAGATTRAPGARASSLRGSGGRGWGNGAWGLRVVPIDWSATLALARTRVSPAFSCETMDRLGWRGRAWALSWLRRWRQWPWSNSSAELAAASRFRSRLFNSAVQSWLLAQSLKLGFCFNHSSTNASGRAAAKTGVAAVTCSQASTRSSDTKPTREPAPSRSRVKGRSPLWPSSLVSPSRTTSTRSPMARSVLRGSPSSKRCRLAAPIRRACSGGDRRLKGACCSRVSIWAG